MKSCQQTIDHGPRTEDVVVCCLSTVVRGLLSAVLVVALAFPTIAFAEKPVKLGTTFSKVQCDYLGLDWKDTYEKVLDMDFDIIRLGAYWNDIETEEGRYDFSVLDWQIKKAAEKKVPLVLTVGMKAPRWPEFYIPDWVTDKSRLLRGQDVSRDHFLRVKVVDFVEHVVLRYKKNKNIIVWQVENEPLNRFGGDSWYIGKDLLAQEVDTVRRIDEGKRKVLLTAATYPNIILGALARISVKHDPIYESLQLCDIMGLNIYPMVGQKILGLPLFFSTNEGERDRYFKDLFKKIRAAGKDIWVMELQAEPWEPGDLVYIKKEPPKTSSPEKTMEYFKEVRSLGVDTVFLWGAEYWVFRKEKYGDNSWYDILEEIKKTAKG